MNSIFCNPLFYILIVNIFGLIWAVRSWRKNIQEKWMNNLRDAASELIGATELMHGADHQNSSEQLVAAKAEFIAKEQKLLLLFSENSETQKLFAKQTEKLRAAAEKQDIEAYRSELAAFSSQVCKRIMKEWKVVKGWL